MSVCFEPGYTLSRNDLNIFLRNAVGVPVNAYSIYYQLFYVDKTGGEPGVEVPLAAGKKFTPVNPSIGEYYAAIQIPATNPGEYRIRWFFKQNLSDQEEQQVVQVFGIGPQVTGSGGPLILPSPCEKRLIEKFRTLVRDNNPDRNYNFAPPEQESVVGKFNRVFGYIWEDYEIKDFLEMSLHQFNAFPPETEYINSLNTLCQAKITWSTWIICGAVMQALFALSVNWVRNEFDYNIGGISLSLERSSKYQGLADTATQQFDKGTEQKMMTVKVIRGLQQSRFGAGVRSSFGPNLSRGTLSPRSFV